MITATKAVSILYAHLKASELMTGQYKPSGELYKYGRPFSSNKEDVVINSLPINREQLQEGILNINIHIPNIGTGDSSQPNTARLEQLGTIACTAINEVWDNNADYMFNVQQDNIIQDADQSWYVNIRVEFRNVNI